MLRFAPASGATAAVNAAPAAGQFVFLGGAVIAAAGSTVLVCVTADAAADGQETPIEIADKYHDTHFADIVGWVQGQYPDVRRTKLRPTLSKAQPETATGSVSAPSMALDKEPDEDRRKKLGRIYVTYAKLNEKTGRYYSGRTSMIIDLAKDYAIQAALAVAVRDKSHHVDEEAEPKDEGFLEALPDEFDVGTALDYRQRYNDLAYWRIRGREQQLIDFYGGAWSDTGKPYRTYNAVRGVAKGNENGRRFHAEASAYWGELYPYTGY
ncbi:MAG TPA: hypothetical protein VF815_08750 [Myxococcaceae bacterium]